MPIVGMWRARVTAAAMGDGTHSRTIEKHPAPCKASARSRTARASSATWKSRGEGQHMTKRFLGMIEPLVKARGIEKF